MYKYEVKVRAVDIPETWTNFGREFSVVFEVPKSNSQVVAFNEVLDENEYSFDFEVGEHTDVSVSLDNRDDKAPVGFRNTSGFTLFECDDYSVSLVVDREAALQELTDQAQELDMGYSEIGRAGESMEEWTITEDEAEKIKPTDEDSDGPIIRI
jgi:hypothetical protein